jgi:hypothetical protein
MRVRGSFSISFLFLFFKNLTATHEKTKIVKYYETFERYSRSYSPSRAVKGPSQRYNRYLFLNLYHCYYCKFSLAANISAKSSY